MEHPGSLGEDLATDVSGSDDGQWQRCLQAYALSAHAYVECCDGGLEGESQDDAHEREDSQEGEARILPAMFVTRCELGKGRATRASRDICAGEDVSVQQPFTLLRKGGKEGNLAEACLHCLSQFGQCAPQWSRNQAESDVWSFPAGAFDILDGVGCPLRCPNGGCCQALFCSEACVAQALAGHHGILCAATLRPDQVDAHQAIKELSHEWGNPNLNMVAQLTADMLVTMQGGETLGTKNCSAVIVAGSGPADVVSPMPAPMLDRLSSRSWEGLGQDEAEQHRRKGALGAISAHLKVLLGPSCASARDPCVASGLLEPAALSLHIGMLGLVCIHATVDTESEGGTCSADASDANEDIDETRDGHEDHHRRRIEASALVPFVAHCNHSCMPNLETSFRHRVAEPGLWCVCTATRAIAAGEELTIQYVPVVASPLAERREKLQRMWGFECGCVRCAAEETFTEADAKWFCSGCREFREDDDSGSSTGGSSDCGGSDCESEGSSMPAGPE